jgi:hypothetical protein
MVQLEMDLALEKQEDRYWAQVKLREGLSWVP